MPILHIPHNFVLGETLDPTQVNDNFDAVVAVVNGLDNDNFASDAAIVDTKFLFSGSGHNHTGGANGSILPGDSVGIAAGVKEGTINIIRGTLTLTPATTTAAIPYGATFTSIPALYYYAEESDQSNEEDVTVGMNSIFYAHDITTTNFKLTNTSGVTTYEIAWIAMWTV